MAIFIYNNSGGVSSIDSPNGEESKASSSITVKQGSFVSLDANVTSTSLNLGSTGSTSYNLITYLGNNKYFKICKTSYSVDTSNPATWEIYEINTDTGSSTLLNSGSFSITLCFVEGLCTMDENHVVFGSTTATSGYGYLNYVTINSNYSISVTQTSFYYGEISTGYVPRINEIISVSNNKIVVLFSYKYSSKSHRLYYSVHNLNTSTNKFYMTSNYRLSYSSVDGCQMLCNVTSSSYDYDEQWGIIRLIELPNEEDKCLLTYINYSYETLYISKLDCSSVTTYGTGTLTTLTTLSVPSNTNNCMYYSYLQFGHIFGTNCILFNFRLGNNTTQTYSSYLYDGTSMINVTSLINPDNYGIILGFNPYIVHTLSKNYRFNNDTLTLLGTNSSTVSFTPLTHDSNRINSNTRVNYIDNNTLSSGYYLYKLNLTVNEYNYSNLLYGIAKTDITNTGGEVLLPPL